VHSQQIDSDWFLLLGNVNAAANVKDHAASNKEKSQDTMCYSPKSSSIYDSRIEGDNTNPSGKDRGV